MSSRNTFSYDSRGNIVKRVTERNVQYATWVWRHNAQALRLVLTSSFVAGGA